MKKKDLNDLRTKDLKVLRSMVVAKKLEADKVKIEIIGGKQKNLKTVNNLRHEIAQILTLVREKEILEKLNK